MPVLRRLCPLLLGILLLGQPPAPQAAPPSQGYVNFSFDEADIRMVIRLAGEMTGKRFVVDSDVQGTVTLVAPPQVPMEDVYPLFLSILEASGYTVIERGSIHQVVRSSASAVPDAPVYGPDAALPQEGGLITRVFQLEHISATELRNMIQPLVSDGDNGAVQAFENTNHLLVTDTVESLRRVEDILRQLDQPGQSRSVELVPLEHADASDLAEQLNQALNGLESSGSRLSRQMRAVSQGGGTVPALTAVVPIPQGNRLLLAGAPSQLADVRRIIADLDVQSESGAGDLHMLFLKYMDAEEAAEDINALLAKALSEGEAARIAIEPNVSNNALLVKASARDYDLVRQLVEDMDQVPQQVLVEVLIAEISVGDELDLGVEWSTIEVPEEGRTTFIGRSRPGSQDLISNLATNFFFPQGLNLALAKGTFTDAQGNIVPSIPVFLRALAVERNVEILSNVPLWAQNNKPASVSVVENIPLLSSTIQGGSGASRDVIQNIERVDVGIELTLTPHINPENEISLDLNPSIEAIVDEGPSGSFTPTIARRDVTTTVTVPDQSTIIISGLLREDSIDQTSKVPLLGDIPWLGALFRSTSQNKVRNNLLIFVTPRIVTDAAMARQMTEDYSLRTGLQESVNRMVDPPLEELRLEADNPGSP